MHPFRNAMGAYALLVIFFQKRAIAFPEFALLSSMALILSLVMGWVVAARIKRGLKVEPPRFWKIGLLFAYPLFAGHLYMWFLSFPEGRAPFSVPLLFAMLLSAVLAGVQMDRSVARQRS